MFLCWGNLICKVWLSHRYSVFSAIRCLFILISYMGLFELYMVLKFTFDCVLTDDDSETKTVEMDY